MVLFTNLTHLWLFKNPSGFTKWFLEKWRKLSSSSQRGGFSKLDCRRPPARILFWHFFEIIEPVIYSRLYGLIECTNSPVQLKIDDGRCAKFHVRPRTDEIMIGVRPIIRALLFQSWTQKSAISSLHFCGTFFWIDAGFILREMRISRVDLFRANRWPDVGMNIIAPSNEANRRLCQRSNYEYSILFSKNIFAGAWEFVACSE